MIRAWTSLHWVFASQIYRCPHTNWSVIGKAMQFNFLKNFLPELNVDPERVFCEFQKREDPCLTIREHFAVGVPERHCMVELQANISIT